MEKSYVTIIYSIYFFYYEANKINLIIKNIYTKRRRTMRHTKEVVGVGGTLL